MYMGKLKSYFLKQIYSLLLFLSLLCSLLTYFSPFFTTLDDRRNQCDFSQETLPESDGDGDEDDEEENYVCTTFKPGSLVLAKMQGYPW